MKKVIIVNPFNTFFGAIGVLLPQKNKSYEEEFPHVKLAEAAQALRFEKASVVPLEAFIL